MNPTQSTHDLASIESLATDFERESATLEEQIHALEADLEAVRTKHLRTLKRQAGRVAAAEAQLATAVEGSPELFRRPRTHILHGVKVGYALSNGRLEWDDDDTVVGQIQRFRKEDADAFIRTKREPIREALRQLPATELAKLGCRIVGAGDQVVVKRVAGDVEKLVGKLIEKMVAAMVETED